MNLSLPKERNHLVKPNLSRRFAAYGIDLLVLYAIILIPLSGFFSQAIPTELSYRALADYLASQPQIAFSVYFALYAAVFFAFTYFMIMEWKENLL